MIYTSTLIYFQVLLLFFIRKRLRRKNNSTTVILYCSTRVLVVVYYSSICLSSRDQLPGQTDRPCVACLPHTQEPASLDLCSSGEASRHHGYCHSSFSLNTNNCCCLKSAYFTYAPFHHNARLQRFLADVLLGTCTSTDPHKRLLSVMWFEGCCSNAALLFSSQQEIAH
jgi:hypothetical protein